MSACFLGGRTKHVLKVLLCLCVFSIVSMTWVRRSVHDRNNNNNSNNRQMRSGQGDDGKEGGGGDKGRDIRRGSLGLSPNGDYFGNPEDDGERKCSPKTQVAFAKTHKAGSSTIQNILFRFGIKNNSTFAMPAKSWMFSFQDPFEAKTVLDGPWGSLPFDMFVFHSIWNYPEVKKILPSAAYMTILRDPIDAFESNYVYMGLQRAYKMDINEFAQHRAAAGMERGEKTIIGKNQLLWDLGMPARDMENASLVVQRVEELAKQFQLVMIVEMFEESVVLMKELLCWPEQELIYLRQNMRIASVKSNVTEEARRILRNWLWADYVLYDHFLHKFKERVGQFGSERMATEKARLSSLNEKLWTACVKERAGNDKLTGEFKMALPIVLGYVIDETRPWCAMYARSEPMFFRQISELQTMRVNNGKQ